MPIRITGMNSGLDTEALVSELVSAYRKKSEKYTKAQTKLSWKQEAWKELNTKVNTFYTSVRSMKYTSAYNSKKATVSNTDKATVKASSSAVTGTYALEIKKVAKSGYLTGGELEEDIKSSSKLSSLGFDANDGKITVTVGGESKDIDVTRDTTIEEFVKSLNDAGVKANFDEKNHRLFVMATKSGKENDFTLTGANISGNEALIKLGLSVNQEAEKNIYKSYASYARNEDGEAYITFDSEGNMVTNGTYSEDKTSDYLTSVKTEIGTKSALITNNGAKLEYANAYKLVEDANARLTSEEQSIFKTLATESDLTNVYVGDDGNIYDKQDDGTYIKRTDNGIVESFTEEQLTGSGVTLRSGRDALSILEGKSGSTGSAYISAMETLDRYSTSRTEVDADAAEEAYRNGTIDDYTKNLVKEISDARKYIADNKILQNDTGTIEDFAKKVTNAAAVVDGSIELSNSKGAVRILGQDTEIVLNGATFTSTSTDVTVNGLTVSAIAETTDPIWVSVTNDAQGMYDKVKDFIKEYNTLIDEMTGLYNATSAKGYEPLTSEEKDAMTDKEVEEWEKKIKDSLLRRDDTLDTLLSSMKNAMFKSYTVNGKNYSLSSFGISTISVLNATKNKENEFHIDGNKDDALVSGKEDKLMAALEEDPDVVANFMMQLAGGLYDAIGKKMSSTTLSSFGVVYNDKQMEKEYSDYTKTISKWEEKLKDIEDSYYKKFSAMESALTKLQSQQSSLANLLG